MADMVERAARAILESGLRYVPETRWEDLAPEEREDHMRAARAAIDAMRTPTDEMRAKAEVLAEEWGDVDADDILLDYTLIVVAALNTHSEPTG